MLKIKKVSLWLGFKLLIIILIAVGLKYGLGKNWPKENLAINIENRPQDGQITREDFAKCLNQSGLLMYGEDTCEYCQLQKKMFGAAFAQINYINCQFDREICQEKAIKVFPVWEKGNQKILGIQSFSDLAKLSGCKSPQEI